jgi:RIP metalloprotease RseP
MSPVVPLLASSILLSAAGKGLLWILAALGVFIFFSLTILIHEGGHFLAAKALGLRADVFSLGFGPVLWKRRWRGTEYRVSAIPFGGYVALPQLDPAGMERIQGGKDGKKDVKDADPAKPAKERKEFATPLPPAAWWKRILVAAAGPFGNVVFAVVLAFVVWALPPPVPRPLRFGGAVVGSVEKGSDAEAAGLRPGDRILAVAGKPVVSWDDFVTETHLVAESDTIRLSVSNLHDGAVAEISAALSKNRLGYNVVSGAVQAAACGVGELFEGGAAEAAGLQKDDVILAVDGRRVVSPASFARLFGEALAARGGAAAAGAEPVRVRYYRKGREAEAAIALPLRGARVPTRWNGLGAVVDTLSTNVAPGLLEAWSSPFRAGDRILAADGEHVAGWADLAIALYPAARGRREVVFSVSNLLDGAVRDVRDTPARFVFETAAETDVPYPFGPDATGRPLFLADGGYGVLGAVEPAPQCLVVEVMGDSPGEEAGVRPGDVLVALDGVAVLSFDDFQGRVRNSGGRTLALTLMDKDGRLRDVAVTPREMAAEKRGPKHFMVGIVLSPVVPDQGAWAALLAGIAPVEVDASVPQWARQRLPGAQLEGDAKSIWRILGPLVGKAHKGERGRIGKALGGPVTILSSMWVWILLNIPATIAFVRFLNVNLAIINLLPIPVLDGGHIVFALWRGLTGRELPARVIEILVNAFTFLILALFVWLSLHDVWSLSKLFGGR